MNHESMKEGRYVPEIVFCCYNCLDFSEKSFSKCELLVFQVLESRKTVLRKSCASSRQMAENL
jgi:hypothetical protein